MCYLEVMFVTFVAFIASCALGEQIRCDVKGSDTASVHEQFK